MGLDELSRRGQEGRESLRILSEQVSPIRKAAKELYSKPTLSRFPLEVMLGIRRYDESLDASALSDNFSLRRIHRLALDKGYTEIDNAPTFIKYYEEQKRKERLMRGSLQLTGNIQREVINITSTRMWKA